MAIVTLHRQHAHARWSSDTVNGLCNQAETFIQQMAVKWACASQLHSPGIPGRSEGQKWRMKAFHDARVAKLACV